LLDEVTQVINHFEDFGYQASALTLEVLRMNNLQMIPTPTKIGWRERGFDNDL